MKRMALAFVTLAVVCFASTSAQAGPYGYGGGYGGYGGYGGGYGGSWGGGYGARQPIYHAPSVHFDRVYHADFGHWTPGRGYHTHGHTHIVPHFTPGHFDTLHRNHIHSNPWYHH